MKSHKLTIFMIIIVLSLGAYFLIKSSNKETSTLAENENLISSSTNINVNENNLVNSDINETIENKNTNKTDTADKKNIQTSDNSNKKKTSTTNNLTSNKNNVNTNKNNINNNITSANSNQVNNVQVPPIPPTQDNNENSQKAEQELAIAKINYNKELQEIEKWYNTEVSKIQDELNTTTSKMRIAGGPATEADVQKAFNKFKNIKTEVSQAGLTNTGQGQNAIKQAENNYYNTRSRYQYAQEIEKLNTKKDTLYTQKVTKLNKALSTFTEKLNEIRKKYNV